MTTFDVVVRGGTVATAADRFTADVAVADGRIAALGHDLAGAEVIDATGKLVLPGGVDGHCHIEQRSAAGVMNADGFESATASAARGGTTTVIPFAAQPPGASLAEAAADYHARAARGAIVDYALHLILADPRPEVLTNELPPLVEAGHASLKIFLTYDIRLDDERALAVFAAARRHNLMVCVHAENHAMIAWLRERLVARGHGDARYHATSHPRHGEAEAVHRAIALARLVDQPLMIFHVSCTEALAEIRRARAAGVKLFAETCTHYLTLTRDALARDDGRGAEWICSPPLREAHDVEALWRALEDGTLATVSSDHAPYAADATGKYGAGPAPAFTDVPNGLPGLAFRLPLLFDAMVRRRGLRLEDFVRLTASEPARVYNLHDRKGSIAIGKDADLAIWDPTRRVTLAHALAGDGAGYTPFEGLEVQGWPVQVLRRGETVVQDGEVTAAPGSGRFLPRRGGEAAEPSGRPVAEMDAGRNFGAKLL
ncbi:MAG: dihydropyrimidinase [Alphaproteobacteria bacterium]|jgi:dihydropyrimidinase|nr:dihydropyrimidinase [Alphaproteobacteria bacterium]